MSQKCAKSPLSLAVQNFQQHCAKVCRIAGGGRQLVAGCRGLDGEDQCVLACAGWGGWRREAGQCVDWVDSGTLVTSNIALCPHIAQHWTVDSGHGRDREDGRR